MFVFLIIIKSKFCLLRNIKIIIIYYEENILFIWYFIMHVYDKTVSVMIPCIKNRD